MIIETHPFEDNEELVQHYSDIGVMLEQMETGEKYSEPIDIWPCPFTYVETDEPCDNNSDVEKN